MSEIVGFKEWLPVCSALASGRQSIILRKGGIHEGREGFSFAHHEFYLFPTRFHATAEQIKESALTDFQVEPMPEFQVGDEVVIEHYVKVEWAKTLTEYEQVLALDSQHIYSEKTVRDRFFWEGKGMASGSIHVAKVQVFALTKKWIFPYQTRHGGCRSWITLDEPPENLSMES